jgi:hypothetical protein
MAPVIIDERDLIYLAIPYTHDDEEVMDWRAEVSDYICSELMKQGMYIYAPISSCHHIAKKYGLPRDWQFWKGLDTAFIKSCKKIIVIMLDGYKESTGVNAEIELAKKYGVKVEYLDPTEYLEEMEKMAA